MIWDFMGRRPLSTRDYVVSIEDGPRLLNHVSKVRLDSLTRVNSLEIVKYRKFRWNQFEPHFWLFRTQKIWWWCWLSRDISVQSPNFYGQFSATKTTDFDLN